MLNTNLVGFAIIGLALVTGVCCHFASAQEVSLDYSDRAPFGFDGKIDKVTVD